MRERGWPTDGQTGRRAARRGARPRCGATKPILHDGRARTLEEAILWHGGRQGTSTSCWPS
ncbi:di-heme oxidoredictase family protein [Meiothermus sp. PNK-Is4]|uniref:di-heme oxidoredictase family protein n=1 Tax=Meiothermus sp. PNK-Is4 TaxID=2740565 RepID=UPI003529DCC7